MWFEVFLQFQVRCQLPNCSLRWALDIRILTYRGNEVLFRIKMPGAAELPLVWARVSPRVTPRASPRVIAPCHRPVHRTVYETHMFLAFSQKEEARPSKHPFPSKVSATLTRHTKEAYKGPYKEATPYSHNPTSQLSLIFPLFTLPLNSRTRADQRAHPCWEWFRGLSTVCGLEEGVSPALLSSFLHLRCVARNDLEIASTQHFFCNFVFCGALQVAFGVGFRRCALAVSRANCQLVVSK